MVNLLRQLVLSAAMVVLAGMMASAAGLTSAETAIAAGGRQSQGAQLREFKFVAQGGRQIIATTQAGNPGKSKRIVLFTPWLEATDGNLYNAALNALWNVYGKERGLFQLRDARLRPEPSLGGNAVCWRISTGRDIILFFCILVSSSIN